MPRRSFARAALARAVALLCILTAAPLTAQEAPPTIEEKVRGMTKLDGFVPVYWDERTGKLWLELSRFGEEILHYTSLPAGVGSNDLGLNRGDLGGSHVVEFERVGPKVLMVEHNLRFRAVSDDAMERKAVEDAFADAVLWGWTVAAQTDDRVLVDATDFFLHDWHDVIGSLRQSNQGTFRLDASRSAPYLPRTKAFPQNTEVEVTLTFTSDNPGGLVRSVAAEPGALTVRQHHSFVQLPEPMEMREADPRAGYFGVAYMDFATPLGEPMAKRFISRHRLAKVDPSAPVSDAVEPIVYYLDPGTPEPVRSALLEGGNWWNQAFEAAGYRNAFRVEMLPDTADPMDVRYSIIQWVHRSTRGWSYGSSISDPRTGEILKGHVTLGSLRVRQDYLLAEGLLSPYETGDEVSAEARALALARLRQLSAHEIGHTLGLAHNYIASAQADAGTMSVMDYPHPRARLVDGRIDVSDPYEDRIGEWDKVAIRYGYSDFPDGVNEDSALTAILNEATARGVTFISDQDARPAGSAHPLVHLWDNGGNVAAELERMLDVRRVALERFGERAIRRGMPMATIEEALVPLYLHHRYQTEATSKVVGGVEYAYTLRGDGAPPPRPVPGNDQRTALNALLRTLSVSELILPEAVLDVLPPRPYGWGMHQELFDRYTGLVFDAVAPAATAADMTLSMLLQPQRAARLVQQNARDGSLPSLIEVLDAVEGAILRDAPADGYEGEVARAVQRVYVDRLTTLATNADMPQVRALATYRLGQLRETMLRQPGRNDAERAHRQMIAMDVRRFLERPAQPVPVQADAPTAPPGQPIGSRGW